MKASDYIVEYLIKQGVTDVFGLPGGVILELLYALERRNPEIMPHLAYHEQGAVFAACGYAQEHGKLGVAYATRGPGVTNIITGIADAYYDSIPLLVLTAHSNVQNRGSMRIEIDQEMDPMPMVSSITKYAIRVDHASELCHELERACSMALSGRKGPVLLDIYTEIFQEDIIADDMSAHILASSLQDMNKAVTELHSALTHARRPVLLIGDGIKQSDSTALVKQLAEQMRIPVLSSRSAQDVMPKSPYYFGFVGSHGMRQSNFVLSKADLIISLGNRMSFPVNSVSYRPLLENTKTIRIDIDETEFSREIPNSTCFRLDIAALLPRLLGESWAYESDGAWLSVCKTLKDKLWEYDKGAPVQAMAQILRMIKAELPIICDVGNHEFWLSHAYAYTGIENQILYSKSFGTLGCSICKAIGAYYATRRPAVCFVGDQGFQLNLQELQFIASQRLPILIVLINNHSSGMIRSQQKQRYHGHYLHTTYASGYSAPDFRAIVMAYGLRYFKAESFDGAYFFTEPAAPALVEVCIDEEFDLGPTLPAGNPIQQLFPALPDAVYRELDEL